MIVKGDTINTRSLTTRKDFQMPREKKEGLIAVSFRIRPEIRTWISVEAAQKHDRPANWLVNKLLEEAYAKAQQIQGAQQ
jgi:hypothetical protein